MTYLLANIVNDPKDEQKRTINLSNAAFIKRVGNVLGGKNILKEIGFVDELGMFKLYNPNLDEVNQWIGLINDAIKYKL
jgi:hypothetical protein